MAAPTIVKGEGSFEELLGARLWIHAEADGEAGVERVDGQRRIKSVKA